MNAQVFQPLLELDGRDGVTLTRHDGAIAARILRGDIEIMVTVAGDVPEWFVDVRHVTSDASVSDWLDYHGYDNTPETELVRDMAQEIRQLIEGLMTRELRFVPNPKRLTKGALEWCVDGRWSQVIPFTSESAS